MLRSKDFLKDSSGTLNGKLRTYVTAGIIFAAMTIADDSKVEVADGASERSILARAARLQVAMANTGVGEGMHGWGFRSSGV